MLVFPSELIAEWSSYPKRKVIHEHSTGVRAGGTKRAQAEVTFINKGLKRLFSTRGSLKIMQTFWTLMDWIGCGHNKLLDDIHSRMAGLHDDELNFVIARINFAMLLTLCPSNHKLFSLFFTGISVQSNAIREVRTSIERMSPETSTDFRQGDIARSIRDLRDKANSDKALSGSFLMIADFVIAIAQEDLNLKKAMLTTNNPTTSTEHLALVKKVRRTIAEAFNVPAYYVDIRSIETTEWRHHFNMLSMIKVSQRKGSGGIMSVSSSDKAFVQAVGKIGGKIKVRSMLQVEITSTDSNLRKHFLFGEKNPLKREIEANVRDVLGNQGGIECVVSRPRFKTKSTNEGRVGGLDAASKAIVIDAAAKRYTSMPLRIQKMVYNVFANSLEREVYFLKGKIDGGGDVYNLHNIIYHSVWNKKTRAALLQHFRKQANSLRKIPGWKPATKVISDMDDTLVCSGGRWPAGCDNRIPRHEVYPGALRFFAAITKRAQRRQNESMEYADIAPTSVAEPREAPGSPMSPLVRKLDVSKPMGSPGPSLRERIMLGEIASISEADHFRESEDDEEMSEESTSNVSTPRIVSNGSSATAPIDSNKFRDDFFELTMSAPPDIRLHIDESNAAPKSSPPTDSKINVELRTESDPSAPSIPLGAAVISPVITSLKRTSHSRPKSVDFSQLRKLKSTHDFSGPIMKRKRLGSGRKAFEMVVTPRQRRKSTEARRNSPSVFCFNSTEIREHALSPSSSSSQRSRSGLKRRSRSVSVTRRMRALHIDTGSAESGPHSRAEDEPKEAEKHILGQGVRCNLIFLSARPHAYKDVAEKGSFNVFKSLSDRMSESGAPTLIPGNMNSSVMSALKSLCHVTSSFVSRNTREEKASAKTAGWTAAGMEKVRSYFQLADLYPEDHFVFIGDNGQADCFAAEVMANISLMPKGEKMRHFQVAKTPFRASAYRSQFKAAFIHRVLPVEATNTHYPEMFRSGTVEDWLHARDLERIYFFDTYIEAAILAFKTKPEALLEVEDIYDVAHEAMLDCWKLAIDYPKWVRRCLLQKSNGYIGRIIEDCEAVNELLSHDGFEGKINTGPLRAILESARTRLQKKRPSKARTSAMDDHGGIFVMEPS